MAGSIEVTYDAAQERWQISSPLFTLTIGLTEGRRLAVLSWRNALTGTEWVKVPVPVFGFGTAIDGVPVTSLSPKNNSGSFVFVDAQQRKRENLTELRFRLKHQRLALTATLWLRTFEGSAALEMGFVLRNESSEPVEVNGLAPLVLTVHPSTQIRLLTLTGGRYDDKFPPSSFSLTEQTLQDGASVRIFCGDEGRSSAKDIPWFALGLASDTGEILEGIVGGLEWSGLWRGLIQKQGNAVTVQMDATEVVHRLSPNSEIHSPSAFLSLFTGDWDDAGWQLHQ
ncbi:MAG: hypothetical protein DFNUSKGM_002424, partial [Candidatus Fervidibacter sacchari]